MYVLDIFDRDSLLSDVLMSIPGGTVKATSLPCQPKRQNKSIPDPSPNFTGRRDYLEKLKNFFDPRVEQPQRRRDFLLYGMGGAGKTQICLKFIEECSDW